MRGWGRSPGGGGSEEGGWAGPRGEGLDGGGWDGGLDGGGWGRGPGEGVWMEGLVGVAEKGLGWKGSLEE